MAGYWNQSKVMKESAKMGKINNNNNNNNNNNMQGCPSPMKKKKKTKKRMESICRWIHALNILMNGFWFCTQEIWIALWTGGENHREREREEEEEEEEEDRYREVNGGGGAPVFERGEIVSPSSLLFLVISTCINNNNNNKYSIFGTLNSKP